MKAIIQRVSNAKVEVDGSIVGKTDGGFFILLGVYAEDTEADAICLAEKISKLRIFSDNEGKMNLSVKDVGGSALVVSNFTLCADYSHGNRPSFIAAARPEQANALYEKFLALLADRIGHVESGEFGADMKISALCDGPVTIDMDSNILKR
ncbi:MAG: D-tyrosyl-tRNA(Tyr) deacylase [Ruminococcaceae bacterium]|nr:D-tyrosyl-tRNA(Tyr) deacylase [Oscillospiraceae bacterium]